MDERCSALEQEEAWKENEISKAARGIRYYQVDSAASIKRVICTQCNQSNPVTDVDLENLSLDCSECDTTLDLTDPDRIVTVSTKNHPEVAQMQYLHQLQQRQRELAMAHQGTPLQRQSTAYAQQLEALMTRPLPSSLSNLVAAAAAAPYPPRDHPHPNPAYPAVISLADDTACPPQLHRRTRILFLRRGLDRSLVEDLRTRATRLDGVHFTVQLDTQTTDLVTGMSLEAALDWLKLPHLPPSVTLRPVAWLQHLVTSSSQQWHMN
ncbi:hypothetical protein DYB35_011969 [Aphanomyces astaci]|uniref:Uncharacterized protein n=1 Tax=Aphanomyces astaci TaxID=112090 RepID=A0A3R6WVA5_APHAT|nr:hypothetical protein DYB35_011969 [Aphanomyces astaci]